MKSYFNRYYSGILVAGIMVVLVILAVASMVGGAALRTHQENGTDSLFWTKRTD